ncbi:uncharacterized protein LOC131941570 [Physella acuta]|uniref:uncharacterized protein LOC131941570 n=1 Tax=Physella acuta TaxID=109671 RepID=UPI0027DC91BC|nr:uncharacterized protein LOC131941570 [Physella acuta]XP_059156854.1 uncharacterized protein LOC131941570 [Physella acuta]
MNASHVTSMSPNTFRRLLVAHGRSSTLGMFDVSNPIDTEEIIKKLKDIKKQKTATAEDSSKGDALNEHEGENMVAKYYVNNSMPPKDSIINPPLSKLHGHGPQEISSSYSFYKRAFKVNGTEAWEFAMRDLGSIDTLLNRYGYVAPKMRGKLSGEKKGKN